MFALSTSNLSAQPKPLSAHEQLIRADASKRSDFRGFVATLDAVEKRTDLSAAETNLHRYLRAWQLGYAGEYVTSIDLFNQVLRDSQDPTLSFRALASIVNVMIIARQYQEAFAKLAAMLELLPKVTDPEVRAQGLLTAALMHNNVGQYAIGLQYADQLLSEDGVGNLVCAAHQLKIEALFAQRLIKANAEVIDLALRVCAEAKDPVFGNFIRVARARLLLAEGEIKPAVDLLDERYSEIQATGYARLTSEVDSLLAQAYWQRGDLVSTERYATLAISKGIQKEFTGPLVQAHRLLYDVAKKRGDSAEALRHHEKYAQADKGYLDIVSAQQLAYQMVRQQTFANELKIESLNQKNQVLSLKQDLTDKAVTNARLSITLLLTVLASIAFWTWKIHRSRQHFRRLAEQDALTGVYTRRRFFELAEAALESASKSQRELAVLMLDLDQFKVINDRYGHGAGDAVLKGAANACRDTLDQSGLFGRLGGEEFGLLLTDCGQQRALEVAEKLRAAIAQHSIFSVGVEIRVTVSIGVTSSARSGFKLRQLLANADAALYFAKYSGRDRVEAFAT